MIRKLTQLALAGYAAVTLNACELKVTTGPKPERTDSTHVVATVQKEYGCLANIEQLTTNCSDYALTLSYDGQTCEVQVYKGGGRQAMSLLPFAKKVKQGTKLEFNRHNLYNCKEGVGVIYTKDIDFFTRHAENPGG